jgi:DNA-binding transcriptional regulator LsrR (DeoR family)
MSQRTRTSIKKILEEVKNEDIVGVEIRLDWDLPSLVRAQSSRTTTWSLKSHIVMFKDPDSYDNVKATTCERYLSEILGSKDSALLLEMLEGLTVGISEGLGLGPTSEDVHRQAREWQHNQYIDSGLGGLISTAQLDIGAVLSNFTSKSLGVP